MKIRYYQEGQMVDEIRGDNSFDVKKGVYDPLRSLYESGFIFGKRILIVLVDDKDICRGAFYTKG